ncbi:NTP transferase domain-containing protein [Novosphingobium sp. MMS21-SN21R]|uniref:molybdenum cofactor guanylyltransferase n=1 Tax=Novosphingobium sp. MMS21-SN21R TaxID=2969298 RepID=UPI002888A056|nr:NTP transferase domain-containing protein [Novosphingobium sp. MMS21-SN21R]MDT0507065.1 NTP transferase domain-containing protein [Novosphingobium sp. MMS21-SN21R]
MILGAVLAGGLSTRFGSDKALAELGGETLLALSVKALEAHSDAVVIVGRNKGPACCIPDWPSPNSGPLGGLLAP